jgi:hypothetical protein
LPISNATNALTHSGIFDPAELIHELFMPMLDTAPAMDPAINTIHPLMWAIQCNEISYLYPGI